MHSHKNIFTHLILLFLRELLRSFKIDESCEVTFGAAASASCQATFGGGVSATGARQVPELRGCKDAFSAGLLVKDPTVRKSLVGEAGLDGAEGEVGDLRRSWYH